MKKIFQKIKERYKHDGKIDKVKLIVDFLCVIFIFRMFFVIPTAAKMSMDIEEIPYTQFLDEMDKGLVDTVYLSLDSKDFRYTLKDDEGGESTEREDVIPENMYRTQNPKYDDFKKDLLEADINVKEGRDTSEMISYGFSIGTMMIMLFFFFGLRNQLDGGDNFLSGKGKKDAKKQNILFKDVAGLDEVKEDLMTVVDFLKSPNKYKDAGAKLPKGILFYGPPGTGKTLLAKAIANEAGVEFMAVSASEFDEKFVGVGAQRIRKLFADAKKKSPCIIFIDEIDALGSKRKSTNSSSDKQSINQLLTEMDGFSTDDNIIVIAATNRFEDLDPALTRTGRFGRHFAIPLPVNSSDRKKIIDIHAANKHIGDDVDLDLLAKETLGCSPSDIEDVLNEAAILSVKDGDGVIHKSEIDDAFYKQVMKGHKKKDAERKKEEVLVTAYHESAHALVGTILGQEVTKVTIIPSTSGAGGVTFFNQKKMGMYSKRELINEVKSLYAGRAAEQMLVGEDDITTGASSDIKEATKIINAMIKEYGMGDYGMLHLSSSDVDKKVVMNHAVDLSKRIYDETLQLLEENKEKLDVIAKELLERETITGDEVREIIEKI